MKTRSNKLSRILKEHGLSLDEYREMQERGKSERLELSKKMSNLDKKILNKLNEEVEKNNE